MMKTIAYVMVFCMAGGTASAVEKGRKATLPAVVPQQQMPAGAPQAPAQDAQAQEMMAKMKEWGSPGEGHKVLEQLAGTWNYDGEWRMSPDSPPQSMKGTVTHRLIFGGRFLKQEISAPPMAEGMPPFEGLGLTGYNTMRREYETVWMDNMGTGMMRGQGTFEAASGTLKSEGTFSCPMTGERDRWYRDEWTIVDPNHVLLSSYSNAPDGNEFKGMEMRYTRAQ